MTLWYVMLLVAISFLFFCIQIDALKRESITSLVSFVEMMCSGFVIVYIYQNVKENLWVINLVFALNHDEFTKYIHIRIKSLDRGHRHIHFTQLCAFYFKMWWVVKYSKWRENIIQSSISSLLIKCLSWQQALKLQ